LASSQGCAQPLVGSESGIAGGRETAASVVGQVSPEEGRNGTRGERARSEVSPVDNPVNTDCRGRRGRDRGKKAMAFEWCRDREFLR
jgi:hypothetical protein